MLISGNLCQPKLPDFPNFYPFFPDLNQTHKAGGNTEQKSRSFFFCTAVLPTEKCWPAGKWGSQVWESICLVVLFRTRAAGNELHVLTFTVVLKLLLPRDDGGRCWTSRVATADTNNNITVNKGQRTETLTGRLLKPPSPWKHVTHLLFLLGFKESEQLMFSLLLSMSHSPSVPQPSLHVLHSG